MKTLFGIINSNTKKLPFYLTSIGESFKERHVKRDEGFYSNHFLIILEGKGKLFCEGKEYKLKSGDLIFIKKSVPHSYYPIGGDMHDLWITFDGTGVNSLLDYYEIGDFCISSTKDLQRLIPDFEELWKVALKGVAPERISILFYKFAIEFLATQKNDNDPGALTAAIDYIEKNYSNEITLEQLSAVCSLSKYTFCRQFNREYNMTPFDYILKVRIKNAKQLLAENPNIRLKELSKLCGFNDECYFCRVFKRLELQTPKQFAKTK